MKSFFLRHRTGSALTLAAIMGLTVWSALGGQPFALFKYKASIIKEKAAAIVSAPSPQRLHSETTARTAAMVGETGRPQLVDFYAEWCPSCRALSPGMRKLEEKYHERVDVIHIDIDSGAGRDLRNRYPVRAIPTLYLLDKRGKTIDVIVGGTAPEILDRKLSKL